MKASVLAEICEIIFGFYCFLDAGASGSELINYQPYNSLDLSEIMDPDSALVDIVDQQNGKLNFLDYLHE